MSKEAIILAGGLGTRLRSVVDNVPKPMADVNGRPFLEFLLAYLVDCGIEKVIMAVGYKWEIIKGFFGNKWRGIDIVYSVEEKLLGTGGAIVKALGFTEEKEVFVLNGDTLFKIDLKVLYEFHCEKRSVVTIALKFVKGTDRYGTVEVDSDGRIIGFKEKGKSSSGFINGGVYVVDVGFLEKEALPTRFSFERDFLEKFYITYRFYGVPFDDYFIDIGVPEDYERAKRELFEEFKYR